MRNQAFCVAVQYSTAEPRHAACRARNHVHRCNIVWLKSKRTARRHAMRIAKRVRESKLPKPLQKAQPLLFVISPRINKMHSALQMCSAYIASPQNNE